MKKILLAITAMLMVIFSSVEISFAAGAVSSNAVEKSAVQMPLPLVPGAKVLTLWLANSPTLKNLDQPEVFSFSTNDPARIQGVTNINNPSIEVHLATNSPNGMAVIVAPGGGNTKLVIGGEGVDVANWLNGLGVSAFILRYRLQPYRSGVDALADTERAVRMVRANAPEWGVDPKKIGVMGFSAGGEQAGRAVLFFDEGETNSADVISRQSSRPDFAVLIYPGWKELDLSHVPSNAPPSFLVCAGLDDAPHAKATVNFYNAMFDAKIPVEMHIYGHGGHGGGIRPRNGVPFGNWPKRFVEWSTDLGMLKEP